MIFAGGSDYSNLTRARKAELMQEYWVSLPKTRVLNKKLFVLGVFILLISFAMGVFGYFAYPVIMVAAVRILYTLFRESDYQTLADAPTID